MGRKLFVGSLSFSVTDDKLRDFFSTAGTVTSAKVISDRFTNEPRGFGFVEMNSDEEAQKAINSLNGQPLDGQAVVVNEAREKKPGGGFGGGGSGGQRRFGSGGGGAGGRKGGPRGGGGGFGGGRRSRF